VTPEILPRLPSDKTAAPDAGAKEKTMMIAKKWATALLTVCASGMLMIGCGAPGETDGDVGSTSEALGAGQTVQLMDVATSKCADTTDGDTDVHAYTLPCNGGPYQKWTIVQDGLIPGTFEIRDFKTGKCLDSAGNGHTSTNPCGHDNNYQHWIIQPMGTLNGKEVNRFVNVATSRCLDSNTAGSLYSESCNGGSFQNWVN
jgi:hypothetical protein